MPQRTKRNQLLHRLLSEFESNTKNGSYPSWSDTEFIHLIEYFEENYKLSQALEVANAGVEIYPYQTDMYMSKARLHLYKKQYTEGLDAIEKALVFAPFESELLQMKARLLIELERHPEALDILDDLMKRAVESERVDLYLSKSTVYEDMGDYDRMYACLQNALVMDPLHTEALEKMWICIELSKQYEKSVDFHLALIDIKPYNYLAWYNLGHAYSCLGDYPLAIEAIEYSFLIQADFEQGYLDCAELCFQLKNFRKALSIYRDYEKHFGEDSEIQLCIADCLYSLGKISEAKSELRQLLQLDSYNDEAYYTMALCLIQEGSYEKAVKNLNKAIRIESNREEYYSAMAKCYQKLGKKRKTEHYYQMATRTAREISGYWTDYAEFLIHNEEYSKALDLLDESEDFTVGPEIEYCRIACLMKLGRDKEAMELLESNLKEHFEEHTYLYKLIPEVLEDKTVQSMIYYYRGELVSPLS